METPKKQRKSVEYNGMELVAALMIKYNDFNNFSELSKRIVTMVHDKTTYDASIIFNKPDDFEKYVQDISVKEAIVNKFITNLKESLQNFPVFDPENINMVYISGKINKHQKIQALNANVNNLEAKSDIYVEFNDSKIIGFSIKQSKCATKTNYSVQKILGPEEDKILTDIKKQYLKNNGITCFDKLERDKVNKLFYFQNKDNPYWIELKKMIEIHKIKIIKLLVQSLFCSNVMYEVYEFNGEQLVRLNQQNDTAEISFDEHLPYYYCKMGSERETAKLFYRLVVGKKVFRVEIRWKGNIYNSSPQFQLHEE
jgi:hypothetical protein